MSPEKPIIVIVHGAWQGPHQYAPLTQSLNDKGFTVMQPANPSTSQNRAEVAGKTCYDDANNIRTVMEEPLAAGKEVVMVCHSYGGIPGTLSLEGFQTTDRQAKGLQGGVKRVVYISSFALPAQDMSACDFLGGSYPPNMDRQDDCVAILDGSIFDEMDEETRASLMSTLAFQSTASLETRVHFVGHQLTIPKTYISCLTDTAIPLEAQRAMIAQLGEGTSVEELKCGHIPFLIPRVKSELVDMIERAALT
ncbi:hypothetical protein FOYG_14103 [Fusarium oxysporum NRRL 32931]|uniref:AB hydrolase-1 domain-containing protein n=1 Tax=Fusarium oxysporum NRRL 32931 TaxID=660029 RepID=W9HVV7_FUSOX|nr:hypothetical protein FOYG_14103 [Fusarium oxysporum NRRL 32931]